MGTNRIIMTPEILKLIEDECNRQEIEEGYDAKHDDQHIYGELAAAGATYAFPPERSFIPGIRQALWPFETEQFKQTAVTNPEINPLDGIPKGLSKEGRIVELVKAASLIVKEIARLKRLK